VFIGHFAVGFAAKRWAPRTNLGLLLLAPLLLDVLWPVFVLAGIERFEITPSDNPFLTLTFTQYPWSHSLLLALLWALLLGALYRALGGTTRIALLLGLGVLSHWVLDWITHRPDLPLWPGGPLTGLGLWRSVPGTVAVESVLLLLGALLYFRASRARDAVGKLGPWLYFALLYGLYLLSLVGPPPPAGAHRMVAAVGLLAVLLLPLAGWIDRHRVAVAAT
jgi:hypothetical protein